MNINIPMNINIQSDSKEIIFLRVVSVQFLVRVTGINDGSEDCRILIACACITNIIACFTITNGTLYITAK